VKLLRPATGAFTCRFDESELFIALFCGPSLAGGVWLCARAPVATKASTAAIAKELRIGVFLVWRDVSSKPEVTMRFLPPPLIDGASLAQTPALTVT
jgi:hypothetical protein